MDQRKNCRKEYKEARNQLTKDLVQQKSALICARVLKEDAYKSANLVLAYFPFKNEVDCKMILLDALKKGKTVAFPKTYPNHEMKFFKIHHLENDFVEGKYHIMEPKEDCEELTEQMINHSLQRKVALVPGVAFDEMGNRYGYGGGYYDRFFQKYPECYRIALAYELQISKTPLLCLPTDVFMHKIITEQREIEGTYGTNRNL